ncbi:lysophospholipid acyltransferase family protein [uncultured Cohaesibacter sp.]|uniref:lysophospholipid acyltransferase family protein n=1 Tax=uncultured Cohaesibacter sp. TaxID=1002546 RepID=UPI0029C98645|nr:lysophospholipid acyltransferase family protein [uncultured Cohaesibacter sp.]
MQTVRELKKVFRSKFVLTLGGRLIALWLRLVHATTRMVNDPAEGYARVEGHYPAIVTLWHGQHFMVPLVKRKKDPFKALVSRSGDGHLNSVAAQALGVGVVRGSGGRNRSKTLTKGGISALKNLISCLREGVGVVMTANVPKTGARECGLGVVTLAKLSGRPIIPAAYASSRRIDLDTWDKASINLPFSRAAFIIGDPIYVNREADDEELELMRQQVEAALNEATRKAYAALER